MSTRRNLNLDRTDDLLKSMLVLSRTIQHVLENRAVEVAKEPLNDSKIQILRLLARRGGQSPTQIARFLGVTKPAVTQIVTAMLASRLLRRKDSKEDRRGFTLLLTKRGQRILEQIQDEQRHVVRAAYGRTPSKNPASWVSSLTEIAQALANAQENFEKYCYQCGSHSDGSCVLVGGDANCLFLEGQTGPKKAAAKKTAAK